MIIDKSEIKDMLDSNPGTIVKKKLNASDTEPAIYELQEIENGVVKYWWGVYAQDEEAQDAQLA